MPLLYIPASISYDFTRERERERAKERELKRERESYFDRHRKLNSVRDGLVVEVNQLNVVALRGEEDKLVLGTKI